MCNSLFEAVMQKFYDVENKVNFLHRAVLRLGARCLLELNVLLEPKLKVIGRMWR